MGRKSFLNLSKPLFDVKTDRAVTVLHKFPNGNLVVTTGGEANRAITVNRYGIYIDGNGHAAGPPRVVNAPPETVEYLTLYPNGNVYSKSCCPVQWSSYDIEKDLIQIKVTRRGDKIVGKEFC